MSSVLNETYFCDEQAAFDRLEEIVWPNGPVCPHCGCTGRVKALPGVKDKKGRVRLGLKKCYDCRKQFTVRKGTVFEDSPIPLHVWFQAAYLMCASKKGVSSNQLHRTLGVTLQTAWFMSHRLREAMRTGKLAPMGGAGSVVEADETYFGNVAEPLTHTTRGRPFVRGKLKPGGGPANKRAVIALVERGGNVRTFHVDKANKENVAAIVRENIHRETDLRTDESRLYIEIGAEFASHETVKHSADEYVRGDIHTNTVEGYFSIFKRGMKGIYQHCSEKHLHRYLAEFDFRYNNRIGLGVDDAARTRRILSGIVGKRLTYRDSFSGHA
jgi:transposase-like protein